MTRVVIAMSGGVDSSVSAAILKSQGFDVIGVMMRLWSEPGTEDLNRCCTPDSIAMARRVAAKLDIPFYVLDAKQIFRDIVVDYFLDGYTSGTTPNPCLICNRWIRWDFLLKYARTMGADYLATGHYARVDPSLNFMMDGCEQDRGEFSRNLDADRNTIKLLRGFDANKDQSYVLSLLTQDQLRYALFPIGGFTKPQVRQFARHFRLPVADRAESQDLCFLGDRDYRIFIQKYVPEVVQPGMIVNRDGHYLGAHNGLAFYTIGQRKGLGFSSSKPMYVIGKDLKSNLLIVGTLDELGRQELTAKNINWIGGVPPSYPAKAQVKIRYKAADVEGIITPLYDERVSVQFVKPLRDITPGQLAVFYNGEICLGSGFIEI